MVALEMRKTLILLCALPLLVTGCTVTTQQDAVDTPTQVRTLLFSGIVHGGQQPVSGSTVTLYAAGASGDGSTATSLVSTTTGNDGSFIFSAYTYTCTSQQLYVVATGGNPGLSPSTTNNLQLSLMTALGACSAINSNTNIAINELTTVAAVSTLSSYMTNYASIGSASGDATAMANAFTLAGELVNTSTGTVPGITIPNGYTAPTSLIYTLGDILATCVNSPGSASSSACPTLFADTTPYQGSAPTETIGAMLQLAKKFNQNVTTAYGLATATGPFQPILAAAPADWTVPLLPTNVKRILFVGDSFTHGRYSPVRNYNSANVTDENYNVASNSSRAESSTEPGPYGGIPGIFKEFTVEGGVNYDVHIAAISSSSLTALYSDESQLIANPEWNAVVLQELSDRSIPTSLSGNSSSNPNSFCNAVQTIEQGVHASNVNPTASIYLYETWARADETQSYATSSSTTFASAQSTLTTSYHNAYYQAAFNDGKIAGVAPAGDAWLSEINTSSSDMLQNPYGYTYAGAVSPFLWFLYVSGQTPSSTSASSPDYYHPSIYGAYLNALVLYEEITGLNSTLLGYESAAQSLGISSAIAAQLQSIAHSQVTAGSTTYTGNPCSVT